VNIFLSSIDQFQKVLLQYERVAIFRDQVDGSLRGMFLIDSQTGLNRHGRRYNCVKVSNWFQGTVHALLNLLIFIW
jgi:hypothetical protein